MNLMTQLSMNRTLLLFISFCTLFFTSCKSKNRDGEILTSINNHSKVDPALAGVSATVLDGTVTLTGNCANEDCRENAEDAVEKIDGVKKVVNNIQIAAVTVTDDGTLRTNASQVASQYKGVQADVTNGIITLRGTVENREKLTQLMSEMHALRPRQVENQLVVQNN